MNFGWKVCKRTLRKYCGLLIWNVFSFANSDAIWSDNDFESAKPDGAKFNELPGDVGAGSEHPTVQHKFAALDAEVISLCSALSQHFIILSF